MMSRSSSSLSSVSITSSEDNSASSRSQKLPSAADFNDKSGLETQPKSVQRKILQNIYDDTLRNHNGACFFHTIKSNFSWITIQHLSNWINGYFKFFIFQPAANDEDHNYYVIKCGIENIRLSFGANSSSTDSSELHLTKTRISKINNNNSFHFVNEADESIGYSSDRSDSDSDRNTPILSDFADFEVDVSGLYSQKSNEPLEVDVSREFPTTNDSFFLCKLWLAGFCRLENRCRFSHDLDDDINAQFCQMIGISRYNTNERLILLRNSLPNVCSTHNELNNTAHNSQHCTSLHICAEFIRGSCPAADDVCPLSHYLHSYPNQYILNVYEMNKISDFQIRQQILVQDVFVADASIPSNEHSHAENNDSNYDDKFSTLFDFIVREYKGSCNMRELRCKEGSGIGQVIDIMKFFETDLNKHFIVFQVGKSDDDWIIQCRLQEASFCTSRKHDSIIENSKKDNEMNFPAKGCKKIHTCKYWLAGHCREKENCNKLHDIDSNAIKSHLNIEKFTRQEKLALLRSSFPAVCELYNTSVGCPFKMDCINLHICADFARNECDVDVCTYEHNLKSIHSQTILAKFDMSQNTNEKQFIDAAILVKGNGESKASQRKKVVDIIKYVIDEMNGECSVNHLFDKKLLDIKRNINVVKRFFSKFSKLLVLYDVPKNSNNWLIRVKLQTPPLCFNYLGNSGCQGKCNAFHLCKKWLKLQDDSPCIEQSCSFSHNLKDSYNSQVVKYLPIDDYIGDCIAKNRLPHIIRSSLPSVCTYHNSTLGCPFGNQCTQLHVCVKFMKNTCSDETCLYGHSFMSEKNMRIIEVLGLRHLSTEELISASFYEDNGVNDDMQTDYEEVDMAVPPLEQVIQLQQHPGLYDDDKYREICIDYLRNSCKVGSVCEKNHWKNATYLWQIKNENGSWLAESFSDLINTEIEKAFAIPDNDTFTIKINQRLLKLNFEKNTYRDLNSTTCGDLRRLSTQSYAIRKPKSANSAYYTYWVWYKTPQGQNKWKLFTKQDKSPFQDVLEAKYLTDQYCYIRHDRYPEKVIYLKSMTQTDRNGKLLSKVKRRPLFIQQISNSQQELAKFPEIFAKRHIYTDNVPPKWAPMNALSKLPLDISILNDDSEEYSIIQDAFFRTMKSIHYLSYRAEAKKIKSFKLPDIDDATWNRLSMLKPTILKVYKIQNLLLWQSYKRLKTEKKADPRRPNIAPQDDCRKLFHGTPEENVIKSICRNNFDFRYNERGLYGYGAYFARDASYSNDYTVPNWTSPPPPETLRHMFYCRVIIGDYCKGEKNMRRPPLRIDGDEDSGYYDTLVNDSSDPSIFAISEDHRFYPEYLIQYNFGGRSKQQSTVCTLL